jgi:hypothetical protein
MTLTPSIDSLVEASFQSTNNISAEQLMASLVTETETEIHTYCLPVSKNLNELINGADQEAIIGLVAKMGKIL